MLVILVAIWAWLGLPLLVFGLKAWTCGGEYVRARWPLVAIYCAMPVTVEVAGRLGFYSPLSGIPLLFAPPVVAVFLLGGPKRKTPRGFDVKLPSTSPPDADKVGDP